MGDIDGDATVALLRCIVDLVVVAELGQILGGQDLGDGGGEGRFPVIHMADGANVAVGLVSLENFFVIQNATENKGYFSISTCTSVGDPNTFNLDQDLHPESSPIWIRIGAVSHILITFLFFYSVKIFCNYRYRYTK